LVTSLSSGKKDLNRVPAVSGGAHSIRNKNDTAKSQKGKRVALNKIAFLRGAIVTPPSPRIDWSLLVGRILIVPALIHAGISKVGEFGPIAQAMGGDPQMLQRFFPDQTPLFHFPAPELFLGIAILFDLGGALLVIAGLRTRAVALLLLAYVILAVAIYHSDIRTQANVIVLLVNAPLFGGLLILSGVGAGHWSLDGALARSRKYASTRE
jgi:uncharacterized membrane protein YphA (DoxX/SURF4 family)